MSNRKEVLQLSLNFTKEEVIIYTDNLGGVQYHARSECNLLQCRFVSNVISPVPNN